jgi:small-conductance mechanosensitive channel
VEEIKTWIQDLFITDNPVIAVIIIVAMFFIATIIHFIVYKVFKKIISRKKESETLKIIRGETKGATLFLLYVIVLFATLPLLEVSEPVNSGLAKTYTILLIVVGTWLLIKITRIFVEVFLLKYDVSAEDNLKARKVSTQLKVFERIVVVMIIIIGLSTALMQFDKIRQIGVNLLASAGIAGIIIGIAAQNSLANILAGFQIAVTQPIRIDDVVIVEGEWGWVEEITLTYVVIRIWDKRRLIVPISYFINKPFQNWTRVSADILGTVFIYTDYTIPVNAIREELTRILEKDPHWDKQVNVVQVTGAKENTVEIRALVSASDSPAAWNLRVNVREKLIAFLQENYPEALPRTRIEVLPESNQQLFKQNEPNRS